MRDVILLAHGSPDPRAQQAAHELARAVEVQHADARMHCAFLDHGPTLGRVVQDLADNGTRRAVVVPAFLANAHHVRVDVPREVEAAQSQSSVALVVTMPIGTDGALLQLLDESLPSGPVMLAVAGTRDPRAQAQLERVAARWSRRRAAPVMVAHASLGTPSVPDALVALEGDGHERAAIASFVLFPGVLPDRIKAEAGDRFVTGPLYSSPAAVSVIVDRIRSAA
jgi:sirohydrochlorin ferrochelatase